MTTSHRHGKTGTLATAGDADARLTSLEARVAKLETPVVTPTPPASTWFGLADPWAGIPFGSLPDAPAGQWWPSGGDKGGATINGPRTYRNRPAGQNVVVLDGISNAVIDLIDFDTVPEGIYLNNCTNVTIGRIRARNIFGPFTRTGFHSGNLIQATNCSGLQIHDLQVTQPATVPAGYSAYGTEDIVSLGGAPGSWGNVTVERFKFDGGAWQSPSGTGLFIGDGASGHDVTVRDGILLNPGQCAIGTGEEGPYTFQRIDVKSTRAGVNTALQLRSPRIAMGGIRVDWPGAAAYTPGVPFTDLGGNVWAAKL
jgi:hypothetical protein